MKAKLSGDTLVIRGYVGEDIVEVIKKACEENKVKAGCVTAIGAVDKCEMGAYSVAKKEYHKNLYEGEFELVSLVGNISEKDGEVYTHFHVSIADKDGNIYAGHLNYARICVTLEAFVKVIDTKIDRELDEEIGINMIKF